MGPEDEQSNYRLAAESLIDPAGIAPEHARIWLRDGHYTLHHVGGLSRKTLVGGREADWLILEPGDLIQIGPNRFEFDEQPAEG